METKFTKAMEYYNNLLSQVKVGSKEFKLLCLAKFKYIQDI